MKKPTSNEILNNIHVGKRTDSGDLVINGNLGQTGQAIFTVDVHGTGTANTFTARSTR